MCCGPEEPPRRLPSCAFYNIHFLGLSQEDAYKSKLLNVKHLTRLYNIVAISELHVSALDAEHLFFRFVPNTIRFYEGGMAYVVQKAWALAHRYPSQAHHPAHHQAHNPAHQPLHQPA